MYVMERDGTNKRHPKPALTHIILWFIKCVGDVARFIDLDQVSLKAQCWYIPEMRNSRIPEMYCKRCPFLGGTRIVHFWYTRNGHSLLCSHIILHFRQTLAVRKRS